MTEPNLDERLEEILWDLLRMDWHINHMAEDLNEKDTADDRQANVEEAIKELKALIANQVREARIKELKLWQSYWKNGKDTRNTDSYVSDRIKELGE